MFALLLPEASCIDPQVLENILWNIFLSSIRSLGQHSLEPLSVFKPFSATSLWQVGGHVDIKFFVGGGVGGYHKMINMVENKNLDDHDFKRQPSPPEKNIDIPWCGKLSK